MNEIIKDFLANISSLHQLDAANLPNEVIEEMSQMSSDELYRVCTQFVVLKNNVPTKEKMINLTEEEILVMSEDYATELLKRLRD